MVLYNNGWCAPLYILNLDLGHPSVAWLMAANGQFFTVDDGGSCVISLIYIHTITEQPSINSYVVLTNYTVLKVSVGV